MLTLKYFSLFVVFLLAVVLNKQVKSLELDRYRQEALAQHNIYRAQCKADALQKNSTLDQIAQSWCEQLAATNQFNHSGTVDYGENSYKKAPFDFKNDNGATPVTAWFSTRSKYSDANPADALDFTQVVWKNTKLFGLGVCSIPNNGVLFVANYYPRGNYKDQFTQNVNC
ncbi:unnamed protein product [Rotaria socialis]|uniref:SCP domain-containing protein n=1 Tax=Rotaria socialis TaxID=392032 RepID=A0A819ZZV9_9BILA|nr:unnamed protein product [Rotaria socialis]CAF3208307.1 unnamed protein product [Rotaria socialis]CAF3333203.1 unnamed protein product [Rotaria socialis]CAF3445876.1 unnamed protein product [Rotaria socialis]CAF3533320.1 unnamed protein product [Rotaria socialis]